MDFQFTIPYETPAKKNSRVVLKNGRNIPSARYREWEQNAYIFLKASKIKSVKTPIGTPIEIQLRFIHSDKRRRDSDNQASSVLDLLQDAGILQDDSWQIVRKLVVENYAGKKACCIIRINDYIGEDDLQ